jgi:DNA topoisomerase-2
MLIRRFAGITRLENLSGLISSQATLWQLPMRLGGKLPFSANGAPVRTRTTKAMHLVSDEPDSGTESENFLKVNKAKTVKKLDSRPVEEIYQKKTQLEHILLRPDTYIGSVERQELQQWVYDRPTGRMVQRNVSFVPGLFKIFDELLVNAADNKVRDPSMDTLKVDIDRSSGKISVYNSGRGIPIELHKKEKVYVPELIFGQLLTSSNYDDAQKKVTGGRNGYGAKLCNIFSREFIIETADSQRRKKYKQIFSANMSKRGEPIISDYNKEDFTRITFTPDLSKFGMENLDDDIVALLERRVYDMAGCVRDVKVFLNGDRIPIRTFKDYVAHFISKPETNSEEGASTTPPPIIIHEKFNDRWEICVASSEGSFQQMSFVNSICTYKGGMHVNYIVDQLTASLYETLKKKHKDMTSLKPANIKNHLSVFVNCQIENPTFDSQTKEYMTLRASAFGSKCLLGDDFMKKVLKVGIVENVLSWARFKQNQQLKKTDGAKRTRLSGITKLDDANNAGTKNAKNCALIITEGDSAKALAVSGLGVVGRDNYGVFPLRGKLLNVREASHKQILENAEINHIKQILGLQHGQVYKSVDTLRYGSLMIMTDQDHDGSHIKGLVINFLDHFFPSLLKMPGFLVEFITPIVKVTKGREEIAFYTIPEYEAWRAANDEGRGWHVKYYKGLGTSTAADARKYFAAMSRHRKVFAPVDDEDRRLVDMAFSKKRADERKEWLKTCTDETFMDTSGEVIKVADFINKELILFSMADNVRSIPSVVDGLKPGHRKILFSCFKRKLKGEIKVAQLAGYVSEHSAYHHGEQSLCSTIIGMAQNFVGSNNVNLLEPIGQFGTRLQGGKDAASPRYVFTSLSTFARLLFRAEDDALLRYLNDDGQSIEPQWYIPILPLVLVNGCEGIGTGWMTAIPNYNPRDVASNVLRLMDGLEAEPMHPWWLGFRGTVEAQGSDRYRVSGIWNKLDSNTLEITELPVGTWTQSFKEMLETMLAGGEKESAAIKDYKEYHTDTTVKFVISMTDEQMRAAESDGIEKRFKLASTVNINNIVCFDGQGRLRKYSSPDSILSEFYHLRLDYYGKRKEWMADVLTKDWTRLDNRVRFVLEIIEGKLIVQNRKKVDIIADLLKRGYAKDAKAADSVNGDEEVDTSSKDFDYLLGMPIYSLTREKVEKLMAERSGKEEELDQLLKKTPKDLWRADLAEFLNVWENHEAELDKALTKANGAVRTRMLAGGKKVADEVYNIKSGKKTNVKKNKAPSKKAALSDEDERSESESDFELDNDSPPAKRPAARPRAAAKSKPIELDDVPTISIKPIVKPMILDEETINSMPLAERINYMLQNKSRQTTLDSFKPVTSAGISRKRIIESDDD